MAITFDFTGQVVLVTGGYSGLGKTVALAFADFGAEAVVIVGRNRERCQAMEAELAAKGVKAAGIAADVRKSAEIKVAVAEALKRFGKIDVLVNSAGIFRMAPALETSDEEWQDVLDTNLTGPFIFCREVGAAMIEKGYGRIVNIASTDAISAIPDEVAYCSSKSALVAMTRVMAVEWVKKGVNVNTVSPSDFATPMTAPFLSDPAVLAAQMAGAPVGRVGRPEEIIPVVLYLASPEAEMVVGHNFAIDGGRSII